MKKTIYLWLSMFAFLIVGNVVNAQIVTFDPSTLKVGESKLVSIAIVGTNSEAPTVLSRQGLGNQGPLKGDTYSVPVSANAAIVWVLKRENDKAANATPDKVVKRFSFKTSDGTLGIDEQARNRYIKEFSENWCHMEINKAASGEAYSIGHSIVNDSKWPSYKACWHYNPTTSTTSITQHSSSDDVAFAADHNYEFYFIEYKVPNATEEDVAVYQVAYDKALETYDYLLTLDTNLDNLKASSSSDYGKFDATKIEQLKALKGGNPSRDKYSTNDLQTDVLNAAMNLQEFGKEQFGSSFYRTSIVPTQGWYRLKAKKSNAYLNSDATFAGTELKYDGSQYFYLRSNSDASDRFELYTFDGLKTGVESRIGAYGNVKFFQLNTCGEKGLYMKSGGSNPNKWVGINEDNTIRYEGNTTDVLDNLLFFDMEPVSTEEVMVTLVPDGDYKLSFNGISKDGTYTVTNGKIMVNDAEYQLVSYNGMNYAIGDELVATLKADLTPYNFSKNKNNPNNALPYPGFRLTPVIEPTVDEVSVSSLTNFAAGDLNGKKVKVTGTVDFQNIENAGATDLSLVDYQPFHAYNAVTLSNALKYTRAFNVAATGAYSTKEAPKWQTICLPFDVEKVDAYCPVTYTGGDASVNWTAGVREDLSPVADYWLYELTATGFERSTTGIKANVPYIIAFPYSWINGGETGSYAPKLNISGDVTFSGKAVSATENVLNEGTEFNMASNFANVAAGENVYVLDANGEYFEKAVASANPFRPYAVLPSVGTGEAPSRLFLFEGGISPTGLSEISSMKAKVNVLSVPGGVNVISEEAHVVRICSVNGAELGRVNVSEGIQMITLPVGVFVIDGIKVVVNE